MFAGVFSATGRYTVVSQQTPLATKYVCMLRPYMRYSYTLVPFVDGQVGVEYTPPIYVYSERGAYYTFRGVTCYVMVSVHLRCRRLVISRAQHLRYCYVYGCCRTAWLNFILTVYADMYMYTYMHCIVFC